MATTEAPVEPIDQQRRAVPTDRRTALARAIVAILRQAIADPARVRIELDLDPSGAPRPEDLRGAAARVRIHGPDAVGRLIWPITPDALAEGFLRMSGARLGFERGDLDVAQLLLARPMADGFPAPRPLRPWW